MIVIATQLPSEPPITPEQIAEYTRIDVGHDALTIQMLSMSALALVESYINRVVMQTTFQGTTDCISTSYSLPRSPVMDVESVKVDGQPLVKGVDYKLCHETVVLTALPASPPVITWIAGHQMVPAPIVYAIAILIASGYDQRNGIDPIVMKTVERLCAPYRRVTL